MSLEYCSKCGQPLWDFEPPHECIEFFITDEDEEKVSFWVERPVLLMHKNRRDPGWSEVAEAWGRNYNEDGDYALMEDNIEITIERNGKTRKFSVGAEPDIHYSIEELL